MENFTRVQYVDGRGVNIDEQQEFLRKRLLTVMDKVCDWTEGPVRHKIVILREKSC